ncbi:tRNA adenylyltransferase NDAI_0B02240 [Naumovozyma dairenensis CBS 421]|uniref:CCA tRNA nucleotidyltransferase, mitochondrial n=1 Tax=Naumovozyma dairenensis (strain ATCC 10597 / BCRC 20456 / CBS 421 / NBRC 0211 / NRRL Y-12639) TaxID=1071378 RepID=G0W648_NAUDC|nr:hypothetical protein NDAI_0B02240 [Naumovozyma dairenensis CBS 421]CCD23259.1 hypothetical protein NDAI_0B02240 [Naumovozyma dairenensis CBS 421]
MFRRSLLSSSSILISSPALAVLYLQASSSSSSINSLKKYSKKYLNRNQPTEIVSSKMSNNNGITIGNGNLMELSSSSSSSAPVETPIETPIPSTPLSNLTYENLHSSHNDNERFTLSPTINLTPIEKNICKLLNDYTLHYNELHKHTTVEPLTLRITGGWVRDKLLGQSSHDLDIAINIMSGESFAMGLNDFLNKHYQRYGIKPHSIHKIDKNPAKSKHLETATTKLFGVEVDFVNLRAEEYTELSRIPIMTKFGTPLEDALRRDATLNALFYNIQKNKIEDFTQMGLKDLKMGILRTPLPPRKTFLDDPLRVLRLIRFASRFNFKIDEKVQKEMNDHEINVAFNSKISRERIGVEMEKILNGPNPLLGLDLIQKNHLDNVIFFWHNDENVIKFNKENLDKNDLLQITKIYDQGILNNHLKNLIRNFQEFVSIPLIKSTINEFFTENSDSSLKQNFILASSLTPFANLKIIALPKKKLNNTITVSESIIKEGLKLSKNDAKIVSQVIDLLKDYQGMIKKFVNASSSSTLKTKEQKLKRSEVGMFLKILNGHWQLIHFVSLLNEYLNLLKENNQYKNQLLINSLFNKYESFYAFIFNENLQNSHEIKPLVDGKKLLTLLKMKPGPWLGKINNASIIWQFDNPDGNETQLVEYIKGILQQQGQL